jgi:hypothetical protein
MRRVQRKCMHRGIYVSTLLLHRTLIAGDLDTRSCTSKESEVFA